MPHKHTRRGENKTSTYDLDPAQVAKPLPVTSVSKRKKRKRGADSGKTDSADMPRAFKRLMAFASGKATRNGLDDGNAKGAKTLSKPAVSKIAAATDAAKAELQIRPGERLAEFNHRVDQALPLSGLVGKVKDGKDPLGLKTKRTKKEKKMHKMYDEWREQDAKIKERREEELEEAEEAEMDGEGGVTWKLDLLDAAKGKKSNKKGKRTKHIGETAGKEEDPWEEIKRKRGEAKIGLNEVANAPPDLRAVAQKLVVRGAGVEVSDIPKAAGSLRQREELQTIRNEVVASYRKMMAEKRPEGFKPKEERKEDGLDEAGGGRREKNRYRPAR
ncbi:hypothetical protein B0T17DRAFT_540138 [Bombardia bombarda]|uniref:Uncharacterized protein n=1 Tax=Bombardia bombarda TaxID=252184 RepID=A0AA39WIM2_9PEZI|nr:hypothetical protein B0T17DRAFT_540138 [Bombardia bombarda]